MNSKQNRLEFLDVAKGIGMLCVILGHLSMNRINTVVFTFHMPLFFLIGGYLFKPQESKLLFKKKFKQLLYPYYFTCLCIVGLSILKNIVLRRYDSLLPDLFDWIYAALYASGNNYSKPFYIKSIGAIWFLWAMFLCVLIYNTIVDKKYKWIWVGIIAAIGFISSKLVWLPLSVQSAMFALIFFYIGHLAKEKNVLGHITKKKAFTALVVWLVCMYITKGKFYLVGNYSLNLLIDILGALAGSYVVIFVSIIIEKIDVFKRLFVFWGRNSLVMLCAHIVELTFIPWNRIWGIVGIQNIVLVVICTTLAKLIWCTVIIKCIAYLKSLKLSYTSKRA